MLQLNLSALKPAELRSLLATARARNQGALAEQLEAELATRASGEPGPRPPAPPLAFDDFEPARMVAPGDAPDLRLSAETPARRPAQSRPFAVAAVMAVALGVGVAWGLNGAPGLPRPPSPTATRIAAVAPPAAAPRAMVAHVASVAPVAPAPEPVIRPEPAPPPKAAASPVRTATAETPAPAPRRLDACAAPPTPADRALCSDLGLNLLEHEMREAYGRAMMAGADATALRDSQAAWRAARDPLSDHRALAQLYDRCIRELQAMAGPGDAPP